MMRAILFPRHFVSVDPDAGSNVEGLERIWLDTPEGRVEAWFLPGKARGPAVLFAHGNGESIDLWGKALDPYREMGFSILLPEYRGYGRSAGTPTQEKITDDFIRFYDQIAARPEIDPARILFHGRSLGGGAVGALAAHRPAKALILESTFTSVADMAKAFFVPRALVPDPFDTRAVLRTLDLPVLIIHGTRDTVVRCQHALENERAAKNSRLVTFVCGHNDLPPSFESYWSEIRSFVETSGLIYRAALTPGR